MPRLHHQHLPDRLQYERGGLPSGTLRALEAMGQVVEERCDSDEPYPYIGDIHTIRVMPDGILKGVADPRRGGAAIGF
jgi:gamma-glutamyltranspeptidase/glutathione hydrolase